MGLQQDERSYVLSIVYPYFVLIGDCSPLRGSPITYVMRIVRANLPFEEGLAA